MSGEPHHPCGDGMNQRREGMGWRVADLGHAGARSRSRRRRASLRSLARATWGVDRHLRMGAGGPVRRAWCGGGRWVGLSRVIAAVGGCGWWGVAVGGRPSGYAAACVAGGPCGARRPAEAGSGGVERPLVARDAAGVRGANQAKLGSRTAHLQPPRDRPVVSRWRNRSAPT